MSSTAENINRSKQIGNPCFNQKSSFQLIRTNPRLTTNIKLVVSEDDNIFLESFGEISELNESKFKAWKTSSKSSYDQDVAKFYSQGAITKDIAYKVFEKTNKLSIESNYHNQYDFTYALGSYAKNSKFYDQEFANFSPIWLEPMCIPDYFVIFRVKDPVSVPSKNLQNEDDPNFIKRVEDPSNFTQNIIKNSKVVKTFDLRFRTNIGKYIRNYIKDLNFPEAPLTFNFENNNFSTWNGVSFDEGGFVSKGTLTTDELFNNDQTIREFENYITNGFKRNGVILPNILNMEFLFNDDDSDDFSINRYFGLYVNEAEMAKFKLDSQALFSDRINETSQKPVPQEPNIGKDDLINSQIQTNPNGIKIYTKGVSGNLPSPSQQKDLPRFGYVKDKKNHFYLLDNEGDWADGKELRLVNTRIDWEKFSGFTVPFDYVPGKRSLKRGLPYQTITVQEIPVSGDELTIRFTNRDPEPGGDGAKAVNNYTVEASSVISAGNINDRLYSNQGTKEDVSNAIAKAIRNLSQLNSGGTIFSAVSKNDQIILFSRMRSQNWNKIRVVSYTSRTVPALKFSHGSYNNVSSSNKYFTTPNGATVTSGNILRTTLVGGNNEPDQRLMINANNKPLFAQEDIYIFTSKNRFEKVKNIFDFLDNEEINSTGEIIDFDNFGDRNIVELENNAVPKINKKGEVILYKQFRPSTGFLSIFPIKDFDFDTYISNYGRDADSVPVGSSANGLFNQLLNNTNQSNIEDEIRLIIGPTSDFIQEGGFIKLEGKEKEDGDIEEIDNEYDRLGENENKDLALSSKLVPFINKWVYDDQGFDVRENPYRLNLNQPFRYSNFSPSFKHSTPDPKFYTHEWHYIGTKAPEYLSKDKIKKSYSYFDRDINSDKILGLTANDGYFDEYFQVDSINGETVKSKRKWTLFDNGDIEGFPQTFFRGVKVLLKNKQDRSIATNFNIKNLEFEKTSRFNGYKFSSVIAFGDSGINTKIVKDEKNKTVTLITFVNIKDEVYTKQPSGDHAIDRALLYTLRHKYDPVTGNYSDINLSGALKFFGNNWYNSNTGEYKIESQENSTNGTHSNFKKELTSNDQGGFAKVIINTSIGKFEFSDITEVAKNYFKCLSAKLNGSLMPQVNGSTPFGYPSNSFISKQIPIYKNGGFNFYQNLIGELCFANIAEKINEGNPEIEYITIKQDGTRIFDDFVLKLVEPEMVHKVSTIKSIEDTDRPTKLNLENTIGQKLIPRRIGKVSVLTRYSGNYQPKFLDHLPFKDNKEIYKQGLGNLNIEFDTQDPNFAIIKNLFVKKVNPENQEILELGKQSGFQSVYLKIGEAAIDNIDYMTFNSNWDPHYYKYVSKKQKRRILGTRNPVEDRSFFASKIMSLPDEINLESFTQNHYQFEIDDRQITYNIDVVQKLIDKLKELGIKQVFNNFVNEKFSINDKNTLNDDVDQYIINNITKRYVIKSTQVYEKALPDVSAPDEIDEQYINDITQFQLSNRELIDQKYNITKNIQLREQLNSPLNIVLINNIERGKKKLFSILITLTKK